MVFKHSLKFNESAVVPLAVVTSEHVASDFEMFVVGLILCLHLCYRRIVSRAENAPRDVSGGIAWKM